MKLLSLKTGLKEEKMKSLKIIGLITLTIMLLSPLSGCQEPQKAQITPEKVKTEEPQPKAQPDKEKPIIRVDKPLHDFGKVAPGSKNSCEFEFKNVGNAPLIIKKVHSTCSCSIGKLEKKEYQPGESGKITSSYRASTTEGTVKKHLYIESNDPKNPRFELTLKATIELKVAATPKKLDLLLKEENAGIKPITLRSKDQKEFSIKSITSSNTVITAEFDPTVKASQFVLNPKVNIEKLKKTLNGNIRINLDHPECKTLTVRYTAKPLFEVSRPRIILQNAVPEKPVIKDVWVKSNYGENFEIESIKSEKNYMKILSQKKQANSVKLQVEITPPPRSDQKRRYITDKLKINIKDSDTLTISLSGWYALKQKS
jgi:hypothetical protein